MSKEKKPSSYQKLKQANQMLVDEINILVFEPDSMAATIIKMRCKFHRDTETAIMAGTPTNNLPNNKEAI